MNPPIELDDRQLAFLFLQWDTTTLKGLLAFRDKQITMYELDYVKKRKRRKWIAIGAGISTIVIATLSIVSFLGRFVGTFTVKLETGNVKLTLSETESFAQQSSYLRVNNLYRLQEYTYSNLESIGHDVLDNEDNDLLTISRAVNYSKDETSIKSINYFKYTFYVKNVGDVQSAYDVKVVILETDGQLDDTLRVMVYKNKANDGKHENTIYAKKSATKHIDDEGNESFDEKISDDHYGYAKQFETSDVIATIPVDKFIPGDIDRYTVVFWLEGNDPQSSIEEYAPLNAKLKLGVEINAYEN